MKLTIRQIALFGALGALTFGAKVAMSGLPNIEPVSLMVMLFAVVFGWKGLYPVYLYVLLEILLYGINLWNINYLYVWALLFACALCLRRLKNPVWWALLSGAFGMVFGLLCSPVYMTIGGFDYGIRWWLTGIAFDISHAVGNFVIALILFIPLRKLLTKLYTKLPQ
jgi:energy-coupling factor transport system substrate-specific component